MRGRGQKETLTYLVGVDRVVHQRPTDPACVQRESDAPVHRAGHGGPADESAPIKCEACIK